jgi:hypothetical protein
MSTAFLDINDTSLSLTTADEVISSPGAVLSDSGALSFGESAVLQLKRRPLDVKSDYWSQLSTAPLSAHFGSARHTADLVYEHLKSLIPNPAHLHDLCIIAPSNINQTQLELLLGILSALNIKPSACRRSGVTCTRKAVNSWRKPQPAMAAARCHRIRAGRPTPLRTQDHRHPGSWLFRSTRRLS